MSSPVEDTRSKEQSFEHPASFFDTAVRWETLKCTSRARSVLAGLESDFVDKLVQPLSRASLLACWRPGTPTTADQNEQVRPRFPRVMVEFISPHGASTSVLGVHGSLVFIGTDRTLQFKSPVRFPNYDTTTVLQYRNFSVKKQMRVTNV